jgi:hypothetical protein
MLDIPKSFHLKTVGIAIAVLFGTFSSNAQEDPAIGMAGNPVQFEAVIDPETGDIVVLEVMSPMHDLGGFNTPEGTLTLNEVQPQAFAYFDQQGNIAEAFYAPITPADQAFIFDRLDAGGSITPVTIWGRATRTLPSVDEVQEITEAALNAALGMVCAGSPRAEEISASVRLAVALGLEGSFDLSMTWRPARDCPQ